MNQQNQEFISFDQYNFADYIGEWNCGDIYELVEKKTGIKKSALVSQKIISDYSQEELEWLQQNIDILSQFDHPMIMKILHYNPYNENNLPNPVIITEPILCPLTNVKKLNLNQTQKFIIIHGIALGMSHIHQHEIVHRNVAAEDIFIDINGYPKLANFGYSKSSECKFDLISDIVGVPLYYSPETFRNFEYSQRSDVYSFSIILYEIITGERPYDVYNCHQLYEMVTNNQRPQIPDDVPDCYKRLLEDCWSENQSQRPTFASIVEQLETNQEFIQSGVDESEFLQYLSKVKQYKTSFTPNDKIIKPIKLNNSAELPPNLVNFAPNIKIDSNKRININNFTKESGLYFSTEASIYEIKEKKTSNSYMATIFASEFEKRSVDFLRMISSTVNFLSSFNHPAIIKFVGFSPVNFDDEPYPIIVTESCSRPLIDVIKDAHLGYCPNGWNKTKILINMFGIASAMQYLHSKKYINVDFTNSFFVDENFYPKIFDFCKDEKMKMKMKMSLMIKGLETPALMPETDVINYASLVCSMLNSGEITTNQDKKKPKLDEDIPDSYKELILRCWSDNAEERPSFEEIVNELMSNPAYIDDGVDENEFIDYVNYINEYKPKPESTDPVIDVDYNYNFDDDDESDDEDLLNMELNEKIIEKQKEYRNYKSLSIPTLDINNFEKRSKIGEGQFGAVYKVYDKDLKYIYAAKISKREYYFESQRNNKYIDFEREINIISRLNHPAILGFIGYSPTTFNKVKKPIIITEYVTGGSLLTAINQERNSIAREGWDFTKKLINIYGIASSLAYLHSLNIIHRDLKPENVLLDKYLCPKLADFGLSKFINSSINFSYNNIGSGLKGTLLYISPEIWSSNEYYKPCDVYAFALIVYEIITNDVPFKGKRFDQNQLFQMIFIKNERPIFNSPIPECYKCLIEECWAVDPDERPTFDEIVDLLKSDHDFLTDMAEEVEFIDYMDSIDRPNEELNSSSGKSFQKEFAKPKKKAKKQYVHQDFFIDLNQFIPKKKIFSNDMIKIKLVKHKKTQMIFSAKISKCPIDELTESEIINLSREVNTLSQLNHPAILKFIGYSPINFKKEPKPVIITEYLPDGSLDDLLRDTKRKFALSDTDKLIIIYGVAHAMSFLHSNGILHRDLKPSNIMLCENMYPKLTDFGNSVKRHRETSMTFQSLSSFEISTYLAPEVLNSEEYTKASDVYSYSLIVYQLMTNQDPYRDLIKGNKFVQGVLYEEKRPEFNGPIPNCYKNLIEKCWDIDPNERPTFDEIINCLKLDKSFILPSVDEHNFEFYVKHLDHYDKSFSKESRLLEPEDFANNGGDSTDLVDDSTEEASEKQSDKKEIKDENCGEKISELYSSEFNDEDKIKEVSSRNNKLAGKVIEKKVYPKNSSSENENAEENIGANEQTISNEISLEDDQSAKEIYEEEVSPKNVSLLSEEEVSFEITNSILDEGKRETQHENKGIANYGTSKSASLDSNSNYNAELVQQYLESNDLTNLVHYLNDNCDYEAASQVFDKCYKEFSSIYVDLCKEGMKFNNPVAFHKYAVFLIYNCNENENKNADFDTAKNLLKKSIDSGFNMSHFSLARLYYEHYGDCNSAFQTVKEGASKGDSLSTFLYGFFISRGIGTEKDLINGVSIILKSGNDEFYDMVATDIGLYYFRLNEQKSPNDNSDSDYLKKAFYWFEKAFNIRQTMASINNYGLCFANGIHVSKDVEKAKEIFYIGVQKGFASSMYFLADLLEDSDRSKAAYYYKKAADLGHAASQAKYASIISGNDPETSQNYGNAAPDQSHDESQHLFGLQSEKEDPQQAIVYLKMSAENQIKESQVYLAKKYSLDKEEQENTYKYMSMCLKSGKHLVPLQYAINLYNSQNYKQAFNYFILVSKINNPIALYYIGIMKFYGFGCTKNHKEAFDILKDLADKGIEKAEDFIEDHFCGI